MLFFSLKFLLLIDVHNSEFLFFCVSRVKLVIKLLVVQLSDLTNDFLELLEIPLTQ